MPLFLVMRLSLNMRGLIIRSFCDGKSTDDMEWNNGYSDVIIDQ